MSIKKPEKKDKKKEKKETKTRIQLMKEFQDSLLKT